MVVGFCYAVIPNILGYGCAARPNSFWKRFESDCQVRPNSSWQRRQHPQPQFLIKKHNREGLSGCYSVVHSAKTLLLQCCPQCNVSMCNSPAQLAIYCPLWALPPSRFCSWWRESTSKPDAPKRVWQVSNQHS